jgi:hypothetical protein
MQRQKASQQAKTELIGCNTPLLVATLCSGLFHRLILVMTLSSSRLWFVFGRIIAAVAVCLLASACSMYPLGDSHYPRYFGGHGNMIQPNGFVPPSIQRNNAMFR